MNTVQRTAVLLGRAGLLPFCAAPVLVLADPERAGLYLQAASAYTLAIVCFLVGSWWGIALLRRAPGVLIGSNAMVLAAVVSVVLLPPDAALIVLCVLLLLTVTIEQVHRVFQAQPAYYRTMRLQLTAVAVPAATAAAVLS